VVLLLPNHIAGIIRFFGAGQTVNREFYTSLSGKQQVEGYSTILGQQLIEK